MEPWLVKIGAVAITDGSIGSDACNIGDGNNSLKRSSISGKRRRLEE
jgi:hypothetical protein